MQRISNEQWLAQLMDHSEEARLRAEVERLRIKNERLEGLVRALEANNTELRASRGRAEDRLAALERTTRNIQRELSHGRN